MRIYIIGNDGITLYREAPATVNEGEIAVASNEELRAAPLSGKRLLALWNALPGVEKRRKVGDREALIDQLGIVTETGSGERNRVGCRHAPAQLSPPSVPARDHPARDLALSPLHPELPRCRRTAGRARARHLLRNGAALGAEVRSRDRATAAPASPSGKRVAEVNNRRRYGSRHPGGGCSPASSFFTLSKRKGLPHLSGSCNG